MSNGAEEEWEFELPNIGRASGGGARFLDTNRMGEQKAVLMHVIKSIGEQKSLINISLPVCVFEPRSFLERMTDVWQYATRYLARAASQSDPVERVRLVAAFLVAGLHRGIRQEKPFNPILGETFQARFADGGASIFCEQVSHHPPVSAFEVIAADGGWRFYGHHEYVASFRPNGLTGGQEGPNTVEFADGQRVTFAMPHLRLSGLMFGERVITYADTLEFRDTENDIVCTVQIHPDQVTGLRSWVQSSKTPADTLRGEVKHRGRKVSEITGSWLGDLSFDGEAYWQLSRDKPVLVVQDGDDGDVLKSDARFRDDLVALKAENMAEAETAKRALEEKQRADRKLRNAGRKAA